MDSEKAVKKRAHFYDLKRAVADDYERRFVLEHLEKYKWNISQAAKALNMDRCNFKRMMRKHGIKGGEDLS